MGLCGRHHRPCAVEVGEGRGALYPLESPVSQGLGWTVERLIVRFLEWLVDPETQEEAIAWLMKAKEELGEK